MSTRDPVWRPMAMIAWREVVRFYRQRSRVIGALASPLIFWFVLGSGMGRSMTFGGATGGNYLEFFYPGTLALILLFSSIFATISVIEDRKEGFLQGVLVAPISRLSIVGGKVFGGALLSLFQGILFLALAPLVGGALTLTSVIQAIVIMAGLSFALTGLGFFFAWRLNSVQGYHSIMNMVLFPLWFLSGALFPFEGAPLWLRLPMMVNPMKYGVDALRAVLHGDTSSGEIMLPLLFIVGFGLLVTFASTLSVLRPRQESAV